MGLGGEERVVDCMSWEGWMFAHPVGRRGVASDICMSSVRKIASYKAPSLMSRAVLMFSCVCCSEKLCHMG